MAKFGHSVISEVITRSGVLLVLMLSSHLSLSVVTRDLRAKQIGRQGMRQGSKETTE